MATTSNDCDHGYNTVKEDDTDVYREAMNSVMRTILTMRHLPVSDDWFSAIYETVALDLETNYLDCWNETLSRKMIAAGLNIVKSFCQYDQNEAFTATEARQAEQIMVLASIVVKLDWRQMTA